MSGLGRDINSMAAQAAEGASADLAKEYDGLERDDVLRVVQAAVEQVLTIELPDVLLLQRAPHHFDSELLCQMCAAAEGHVEIDAPQTRETFLKLVKALIAAGIRTDNDLWRIFTSIRAVIDDHGVFDMRKFLERGRQNNGPFPAGLEDPKLLNIVDRYLRRRGVMGDVREKRITQVVNA